MKHSVDINNFFGNVMLRTSEQVFLFGNKKPGVKDLSVREASNPDLFWCSQSLTPFLLPNRAGRTGEMRTLTQPKERSVSSGLCINVTPEEIINQDNALRTTERQAAMLKMVHCRILSLCNEASSTDSTSLSYGELCDLEIAIGSIVDRLEAVCKQ